MQTKEDFYKMGVQLAVDELLKEGANLAKYVKPMIESAKGPKAIEGVVKNKFRGALKNVGVNPETAKAEYQAVKGTPAGRAMRAKGMGAIDKTKGEFRGLLEDAKAKAKAKAK